MATERPDARIVEIHFAPRGYLPNLNYNADCLQIALPSVYAV